MEPYATASQPGPLNGNRPPVNGSNDSFFSQYKTQILYGIAIIVVIVIAMMMFRRKTSSFYTEGGKNKKVSGEVQALKADRKKKKMGREIETTSVNIMTGPSPKKVKVPTAGKL